MNWCKNRSRTVLIDWAIRHELIRKGRAGFDT